MLWEFIATLLVGFAAAGIALSLRLFIKQLPKWVIPSFAGLGMLAFVIYSEYNWYNQIVSRLPNETVVVASVPHTAFYKPWSYIRPQILQFVALDKSSVVNIDESTKLVNLYFFERHMKTQTLAIKVDCNNPELDFSDEMNANILKICP